MSLDEPVSDTDAKLLRKFGGIELVMVIIFTIAFVLIIVILIKRQILRMLLISKRGPHTTVGAGAPQPLAREIEIRLRKIKRLRIEPRMMAEQFNKPSEETSEFDSPPDQYTRSYKYRLKAMDKMTELDDLICSINNKYGRRKGQSVRGYLRMLQKDPYNVVKGGDDTIDKLDEMYEHARYEPKEFGSIQYRKFAYLVEQMKDRVRLYINVPGSLIINTSSKQPKKPPLSSTKIAQNPEIKPEDMEKQQDKDTSQDHKEDVNKEQQDIDQDGKKDEYIDSLLTPAEHTEYQDEEEEIDDVNQPLLAGDALSETTKDSADTIVMVSRGNTQEPSTSGINEQNL